MSQPTGVVQALDAARSLEERGFTFLGGAGPGVDLTYSFADLRREAIKRGHWLKALGLKPGDRLAMVIPDGVDFIPTFLAALWVGVVPVPLYPPLALGKLDSFMEALVGILKVATPRFLVTTGKVQPLLWSIIGKVPTLESIVTVDDLMKPAPGADETPAPCKPEDLAFLQFTSGSTSAPKGVMVTHGNLAANIGAILTAGVAANPETDVGVSWLPLYHDMGLIGHVLAALVGQIKSVFIPTMAFIKNSTLWLETIHKHRGTMSFAPNFAYALVAKRARADQIARWDLSSMRLFGCGAEPINPEVMRAFVDKFAPSGLKPEAISPCYGMAEATLAMSFKQLAEPLKTDAIDEGRYHADKKAAPALPGQRALDVVCCGRVLAGHELAIQDEDGRVLPERAVGEICFRGPSVAVGYWENPEASRAAGLGGSGSWLRTGDLGYLADGEVYVSGRLKDILIINGRNYYPQRIEWAVEEVAGVRKGSAVVFSRPGRSSEEVVVVAESRDPEPAKLGQAIAAKVNEELQLAVADVRLVAPGTLPKTSSGKLQRRKTREQYLAGTLGKDGVRTMGEMGQRLLLARHLAASLVGRAQHTARGIVRRFF